MIETLPERGVVFWPVGTGDSTTIVVDDETVVQIDIHDMVKADDDATPEVAVVDRLMESLPQRDGRPYLAVFALTHADLDHCRGFTDLLSEITIGELWATPRLWREFADGTSAICEDARRFQEEAERRVAATLAAVAAGDEPVSGDRILVIGYDTNHDDHAYSELPDRYLSGPGKAVASLDGKDCTGAFQAFLHAPFRDDCAAARNETSVAMQVVLSEGPSKGRFLLFGDLAHNTIMKVVDYSEANGRADKVGWDVLLAPHHCSKAVMYVDGELQQDVLDALARNAGYPATVVSSSAPVPAANDPGSNPPHALAKARYEEVAESFLCTMEHGGDARPNPVAFAVGADGLRLIEAAVDSELASKGALSAGARGSRLGKVAAAAAAYAAGAVAAAGPAPAADGRTGPDRIRAAVARERGGDTAPGSVTGFGRSAPGGAR